MADNNSLTISLALEGAEAVTTALKRIHQLLENITGVCDGAKDALSFGGQFTNLARGLNSASSSAKTLQESFSKAANNINTATNNIKTLTGTVKDLSKVDIYSAELPNTVNNFQKPSIMKAIPRQTYSMMSGQIDASVLQDFEAPKYGKYEEYKQLKDYYQKFQSLLPDINKGVVTAELQIKEYEKGLTGLNYVSLDKYKAMDDNAKKVFNANPLLSIPDKLSSEITKMLADVEQKFASTIQTKTYESEILKFSQDIPVFRSSNSYEKLLGLAHNAQPLKPNDIFTRQLGTTNDYSVPVLQQPFIDLGISKDKIFQTDSKNTISSISQYSKEWVTNIKELSGKPLQDVVKSFETIQKDSQSITEHIREATQNTKTLQDSGKLVTMQGVTKNSQLFNLSTGQKQLNNNTIQFSAQQFKEAKAYIEGINGYIFDTNARMSSVAKYSTNWVSSIKELRGAQLPDTVKELNRVNVYAQNITEHISKAIDQTKQLKNNLANQTIDTISPTNSDNQFSFLKSADKLGNKFATWFSEGFVKMAGGLLTVGLYSIFHNAVSKITGLVTGTLKKAFQVAVSPIKDTLEVIKQYSTLGQMFSIPKYMTGIEGITSETRNLSGDSLRTGIPINNLAIYNQALKQAGVDSENLGSQMAMLGKQLTKAWSGTANNVNTALSNIGLKVTDLIDLEPDQQLFKVAQAMEKLGDATLKSFTATLLFDRAGHTLLPFFNTYTESIQSSKEVLGELPDVMKKNETSFKRFANALKNIQIKPKQFFAGFTESIVDPINTQLERYVKLDFTDLGRKIARQFSDLTSSFSDTNLSVGEAFTVTVTSLGKAIELTTTKWTEWIVKTFNEIDWNAIGASIADTFMDILDRQLPQLFQTAFKAGWGAIEGAFKGIGDYLKGSTIDTKKRNGSIKTSEEYLAEPRFIEEFLNGSLEEKAQTDEEKANIEKAVTAFVDSLQDTGTSIEKFVKDFVFDTTKPNNAISGEGYLKLLQSKEGNYTAKLRQYAEKNANVSPLPIEEPENTEPFGTKHFAETPTTENIQERALNNVLSEKNIYNTHYLPAYEQWTPTQNYKDLWTPGKNFVPLTNPNQSKISLADAWEALRYYNERIIKDKNDWSLTQTANTTIAGDYKKTNYQRQILSGENIEQQISDVKALKYTYEELISYIENNPALQNQFNLTEEVRLNYKQQIVDLERTLQDLENRQNNMLPRDLVETYHTFDDTIRQLNIDLARTNTETQAMSEWALTDTEIEKQNLDQLRKQLNIIQQLANQTRAYREIVLETENEQSDRVLSLTDKLNDLENTIISLKAQIGENTLSLISEEEIKKINELSVKLRNLEHTSDVLSANRLTWNVDKQVAEYQAKKAKTTKATEIYNANTEYYDSQIRELDSQDTSNMTVEEQAQWQQKRQNLVNEKEKNLEPYKYEMEMAQANEIADPYSIADNMEDAIAQLQNKLKTFGQMTAEVFTNTAETMQSSLGQALYDCITGASSVEEAFQKMGQSILNSIIMTITTLIAQIVVVGGILTALNYLTGGAIASFLKIISAVLPSQGMGAFATGGLVVGKEQVIRVNENGEEYVVNAKATEANKPFLDYLNAGGTAESYMAQIASWDTISSPNITENNINSRHFANNSQNQQNVNISVGAIHNQSEMKRFMRNEGIKQIVDFAGRRGLSIA